MQALPIEKIREAFLKSKSAVKVVRADTGSGKTTRIPLWLLDEQLPFILIEPRRVVVKSIYDYLGQLNPSHNLGYQVRFERNIASRCTGIIVTPGIFLNYLSSSMPLEPSVILIDEFHERHKEVDFILAILKQRRDLHLVLLSATLNVRSLNQYLEYEVFEVNQGSFPVHTHYENLDVIPNHRNLGQRILEGLKRFSWKVVLVFLPGKREIFEVKNFLRAQGYANVYPIYGNQSLQEQFEALRSGTSRVLLSTNILESAMTVEGVDLVIDTGLCRALRYRYGQEVLTLEPIAEDAAEQRKGRTGRTSEGICYRLWSKHAKLESTTQPEILRSDLTDLCLRGRQMALNARSLDYLDSPESYQWDQAENHLRYLGYMDESKEIGSELPLSAKFLALIERCRRLFPAGMEYLLFFIAFVESRSTRIPLVKTSIDEQVLPSDWLLWQVQENDLQSMMGIEYQGFKITFRLLCQYFKVEKAIQKISYEDRGHLLQLLATEFPQSLYYHSKKNLWRNDFSRECQLPEMIDGKHFTAIFAIDLFEVEDSNKRRMIRAEAFFCYEKNRSYSYPATRSEKAEMKTGPNGVQILMRYFFGHTMVGEEVRILQGEDFIRDFCQISSLEKIYPGLAERSYYFEIFEKENSRMVDLTTFIQGKLRDLGVGSYKDLELLSIRDFFDWGFENELERLKKEYPMILEEPGGKYTMHYDPRKKELTFHQEKGFKEPSPLLRKRFRNWKIYWKSKGRCVGL